MIAAGALVVACVGQTNAPPKPQRQRAEEDRVAQLFDTIRKEEGLKPLKRTVPTPYMASLICSVAVTGKPLASVTHYPESNLDSFQSYRTQDLESRPSALRFLTSDQVLTRKVFPQYSVVVFRDVSNPALLVVGVARDESRLGHWWGCTSLNIGNWFEDGCNAYPIKPSISPECIEAK